MVLKDMKIELAERAADFYHDYDYYDFCDNYDNYEDAITDALNILDNKASCLSVLEFLKEAKEEAEPSLQGTAIYLTGAINNYIKEVFINV